MGEPNGSSAGDADIGRADSPDTSEPGQRRLHWNVEQAPLGIVEWTPDHRVKRWNEAASNIFGYDATEMVGRRGDVLVPDDRRDQFDGDWEQLLGDREASHVVVENRRKDGVVVTCEWYSSPIYEDGSVASVLSMVRDVTDQRRRERTIETLHEATRDLMEATTLEEVFRLGIETAEAVLNLPHATVLEYDENEDLLRPTVTSSAYDEQFDEAPTFEVGQGISGRAFETGEVEVHDDGQQDPDTHPGAPESVRSFVAIPMGEYGVLTASSTVVGAFDKHDVAAARVLASNMEAALDRAERERRLERQNERLDEFASVVSHDLRNPLMVARGNVELAQQTGDLDRLDAALDSLDRMEDLIDGLLTLAREGELAGDRTDVALETCAREAFDGLDADEPTLSVATDLETMNANREHLRELLENLFSNAVEHGGGSVSVRIGSLSDRPGFFVADDGPGISDDIRDRIFDHGYSGEGGTGIGLAIVEAIADAHGWTVEVSDAPELGGARFEVRT